MKQSRFTDGQIIAILKQAESGMPVPEVCREHSISSATFYKWLSHFLQMAIQILRYGRFIDGQNEGIGS